MQLMTIGTKYQIVIPKGIRKKVKGITPGAKVIVYFDGQDTIKIRAELRNWLERTRGMMKKAWKGINTTKYLEDLRNEWDSKD